MLIKIVVVTVLGLIIQHILKFVYLMGFHLNYNKHYPGDCKKLPDIQHGSENFFTFPDGLTFITSGFKTQYTDGIALQFMKKHNITGKIYLFNFNDKDGKVSQLSITESEGFSLQKFYPHGISGWQCKKSGKKYIFVVNHEDKGGEYVEKFLYNPSSNILQHIARYHDDTMELLNDVQATSENSFYFTNFGTSHTSGYPMMIQIYGIFSWNTVGYFDGNNYKIVLTGMAMSNGIAMSNDGRYIYICNNLSFDIHVYERQKSNDLVLKQAYPLYTCPDNVIVNPKTDHLYVGCHPILNQALKHLEHPYKKSPSQVLKLEVKDGLINDTIEEFYDHGELIKGSTTALVYNSKMLIGSVRDSLVYCDYKV